MRLSRSLSVLSAGLLFILMAPGALGQSKPETAQDLVGEWRDQNGGLVGVGYRDNSVAFVINQRMYTGNFNPNGFTVIFQPPHHTAFVNPKLPQGVRQKLVERGYQQTGQVDVLSKRELKLAIRLDKANYRVHPNGTVEIQSIQPQGERVVRLVRDGYRFSQVVVNDQAMEAQRKKELETRMESLHRDIEASEARKSELLEQYGQLEREVDALRADLLETYNRFSYLNSDQPSAEDMRLQRERDQAELSRLQTRISQLGEQISATSRSHEQAQGYVRQQEGYLRRRDLTPAQRVDGQVLLEQWQRRAAELQARRDALADDLHLVNRERDSIRRSLQSASKAPTQHQKLLDTRRAQLNALRDRIQARQADMDRIEDEFKETMLRTNKLKGNLLDAQEAYKSAPSFVRRVEARANGTLVFQADFDTPQGELQELSEQIRNAENYAKELEGIRKAALVEFVEAERETIAAGYELADTQWNAAQWRALVELAGDTYDVARRTGEAGIAGAGIELFRKVSEKLIINAVETGIKGEVDAFKQGGLSLSSSVETAIENEIRAAFAGTLSDESDSNEVISDKRAETVASTLVKRVAKDSISRQGRDWITRKIFNTRLGEEVFDAIDGELTSYKDPARLQQKLNKLRQPSEYMKKFRENLGRGLLKDGLVQLGKTLGDEVEIAKFRDYTMKNFLAREKYAAYAVVDNHSFHAEQELAKLMQQKEELLARQVDLQSGFRTVVNQEFDENDRLEISLTLQDTSQAPERSVRVNQTPVQGGNQHYATRISRRMLAPGQPQSLMLTIER